jgi:hypothetical protein
MWNAAKKFLAIFNWLRVSASRRIRLKPAAELVLQPLSRDRLESNFLERRNDWKPPETMQGPSIDWGIMKGAIRPVGYVGGWGLVNGMDATFGRDRD